MITGIFAKLAAWGVAILGLLASLFAVYKAGSSVGKAKQSEADNNAAATRDVNETRAAAATEVQTVKEANDVLTDVNKLPDGAASGELRDKWTRD